MITHAPTPADTHFGTDTDTDTHRKIFPEPTEDDGERRDMILARLRELADVLTAGGRDAKLFNALVVTLAELLTEHDGHLLVDDTPDPKHPSPPSDDQTAPLADEDATPGEDDKAAGDPGDTDSEEEVESPRRRLRPEVRARWEAVMDSHSDDEAALRLGVLVRQLRRRAHRGTLVFFTVGGKRRYPMWQFAGDTTLPGLAAIARALPDSWDPAQVQAVMTTPHPDLLAIDAPGPLAPVEWLWYGGDPHTITTILRTALDRPTHTPEQETSEQHPPHQEPTQEREQDGSSTGE